ncbi:efflux RND transporter periplasmic adaptor subunit [Sphingomonas sp. BK235]|uniref:efflux RND transporter periplasmic adaptor subunit n=1 Tax=Sphingomonas sp. BK235 TaxID=2512131 RepID=UPI001051F8F4|nr:efflux RND transporter periplasmic adaptor subunit [Sphingomonas sp. BK235]TCP31001.1 cobalt-zinc-cadmium efflux system membrane fusion protein [Sphingomonas sp. BK235]
MTKNLLPLPLLIAGLIAGCSRGEEPAPAPTLTAAPGTIALSAEQIARLDIQFAKAEAAIDVPVAEVPATIAPPPNARVAVAATIPGVVTRTMVVEGQQVRAGQPLAVVASRDVLTMQAGMEQASARANVSLLNARRLDQLAREGVIAGSRADEAAAARREAEAELGEQRRALALINAGRSGGSYTLTAPIAGTITKASVQTGMPVDGASAPYVIDAAGRYELTAQLPERLIGTIRPGMTVMLEGVAGTVTSVGSTVEAESRSALLRAKIPAAPGLVAGRATTATLLKPADGAAVSVPAAAVVIIEGRPVAFVRTPKGIVRRAVTSAGAAGDRNVLTTGVKAGEQVAVSGTSELKALAAD